MSITPTIGIIAASRRRTPATLNLGYPIKGTAGDLSDSVGHIYVSKFTLAASGTLQELHAWLGSTTANNGVQRIVIYQDSSGSPGALVAATNQITYTGVIHASQTGFSTALTAGDYWLGTSFVNIGSGGTLSLSVFFDAGTATLKGRASAPDPPPNPFGTVTAGPITRTLSVWAVLV